MKKFKLTILLICLLMPFSFYGCENQNKNSLETPSNFYIENGVIVFNQVENAEYYVIDINGMSITLDAKYSNSVSIIDNQINYNANKIFTVGNSYSIKIKATASNMEDSDFTETISYKHAQSVSKPENVKINGTTLTWDLVKNASFYAVKVLTPYNQIIYDSNSNVLDGDDSATIAKAELTEYTFHSNAFNFSSLLTKAGNYKFYVSAICSDGATYLESEYTEKVTYLHQSKLSTPSNGEITNLADGLYLNTIIDSNTNGLTIMCDSVMKDIELNASYSYVVKADNFVSINLTQLFTEINFDIVRQYEFKVKANYLSSLENKYYSNSDFSAPVYFEKTSMLPEPEIQMSYSQTHNCTEITWDNYTEVENVSQFKVFVVTDTGVSTYHVDNIYSSMLITEENYYAIFIQAIGSGNYLSSNYSNILTTASTPIGTFNVTASGDELNFTNIEHAYYLVEYNNTHEILSTNNYTVDLYTLTENSTEVKVSVFSKNRAAKSILYDLSYNPILSTPYVTSEQGFKSINPYLLTFTPVENAIGYYIYISSSDALVPNTYTKIDYIYTTNVIDLTQYVLNENRNVTYKVKIQAVADLNSIYKNSNLSNEIIVSHVRVLSKPTLKDSNNPISKVVNGNTTYYYLEFKNVDGADSYEVLINYNKIPVVADDVDYYKIDVTKFLTSANNYEIKIRAIPSSSETNVSASEYTVANYTLYKQLPQVENIKVTENDERYTLSFNPVDNAKSYRIRIIKLSDSGYNDYLLSLENPLANPFEIYQAADITDYVQQEGEYYFYITALAQEGGFYGNSDESSNYATLSKLTSLASPSQLTLTNTSSSNITLSWIGDQFADYYLIKITDPRGLQYETKVYGTNKINLNSYFTVQGSYSFDVYSMVTANSANSKLYISSSATNLTENYLYTQEHDFKRYTVYMYGEAANFEINSAQELKNILWYNYLYELDADYKLPLLIPVANDSTLKDEILNLAQDSNDSGIYDFASDTSWSTGKNETQLFKYICEKLLSLYPEMHVLENFEVKRDNDSSIFRLYYKNKLNKTKVGKNLVSETTDYNVLYEYINPNNRRTASTILGIDSKSSVLVETTEQLLHAVENNKKPSFYGNYETAKTVYNNARAVVRAINTKSMTDLEKTTNIYNWLSYAFNLNLYSTKKLAGDNATMVEATMAEYGLKQEFYLEGIFLNLYNSNNGNYDGEVYLGNQVATSASFAKAFSLLCRIEGIEAISINGSYTKNNTTYDHNWNKINLKTDTLGKLWYNVDIALASSDINNSNSTSTSINSHKYFLVDDATLSYHLKTEENVPNIKNYIRSCSTDYNYYKNTSFALTKEEITLVANISSSYTGFAHTLSYIKENEYQAYDNLTSGPKEKFLLNIFFYVKHMLTSNSIDKFTFEFSFDWVENDNNSSSFAMDINLQEDIQALLETATNKYSFNLSLAKAYQQYSNSNLGRTIVTLTFENN